MRASTITGHPAPAPAPAPARRYLVLAAVYAVLALCHVTAAVGRPTVWEIALAAMLGMITMVLLISACRAHRSQ